MPSCVNNNFNFFGSGLSGLGTANMDVVETANLGTEVTLSVPHTIDNNNYAYVLWTTSLDTGAIIYNARITYTK